MTSLMRACVCCLALIGAVVLAAPLHPEGGVSSAQASDKTPVSSGNVYGAEPEAAQNEADGGSDGSAGGDDGANTDGKGNDRGYNQGYSYNTGIKPYTTGYTYYQPFGDAAKGQQQEEDKESTKAPMAGKKISSIKTGKKGAAAAAEQPLPVDLENMFDDNGIPNLDNLKLPPPPKGVKVTPLKFQPITTTTTPPPPPPQNFGDGFDFNQLMGGGGSGGNAMQPQQQQRAQQSPMGDSMFDFAPPSNGNFDFAPNSNGRNAGENTGVNRDFGSVDNFGGNLNNNLDDPYLGDPQLMMDGNTNNGGIGGGGNGAGSNNGGGGFGFEGQQVPSEIVNLNNAFGAGPSSGGNGGGGSNSASAPDDLSNMVLGNLGAAPQQQPQQQPMMDFGEFGSAAQQNPDQAFPFSFPF